MPLITIDLNDFLDSHLGISIDELGNIVSGDRVYSSRPIKQEIADVIYALCENKHTAYIEFPSENSLCKFPILWSMNKWRESQTYHEKAKQRQHQDRVNRFLYEDNVETLTKAAMKEFGFSEEQCRAMAFKWVARGNKGALIICKVDKLKTKEEEL